ncbi:MAG TPA: hypothetical protein VGL86_23855, partial [Polyangia bacterium]
MFAPRALLLLMLAVVGCGDDTSPGATPDLTASVPSDLSTPVDASLPSDLGPNYDLAFSCPRLAGTCVESFFATFASCFHPAGHCQSEGHNLGIMGSWGNCAYYIDTFGPSGVDHEFWQDKKECLTWLSGRTDPQPDEFCP